MADDGSSERQRLRIEARAFRDFADLIKAIRQQYQLTQRAMARTLRVSPGYIGQWELRLSQPSAEITTKICQTFDIPDIEYVQRLAFAQRAPEWLKESIVEMHPKGGGLKVSPLEMRLLGQFRRLSPAQQRRLVERVSGWVDAMTES